MRAVVMRTFGGPEVLGVEEVDLPDPGPGEVVVQVQFASVTFVETQVRAGAFGAPPLPRVLGNGVGGRVVGLGPDVDEGWRGQEVVTTTGGTGGYAEQAIAKAADLVPVPAEIPLPDAVALLADGRTALLIEEVIRFAPGQRVLVLAAAGGVGSLLIQLALSEGAEVIGAAGGARKGVVVANLGAQFADYGDPGWHLGVGSVDVLADGVGGPLGTAATRLVGPGGQVSRYGFASGSDAKPSSSDLRARGVRVHELGGSPGPDRNRGLIERALRVAAAGVWRPVIGQVMPLEEAAAAHGRIESRRTFGKTLLDTR